MANDNAEYPLHCPNCLREDTLYLMERQYVFLPLVDGEIAIGSYDTEPDHEFKSVLYCTGCNSEHEV